MLKVWVLFEQGRGYNASTDVVGIFLTEHVAEQAALEMRKVHFTKIFWADEFEVKE